ncbi:efflux RND transporter permease subunit [Alkalicoccus urumqiensis]|uniref:MFS transporter n=1 Tax=Alkalicoccus urumqiensis TaxID=1548213 RepID=A0A2P6MJU1_ALKUR|nr:efflux RND transporter permease subunit [Alkalicoccus urumqiensis]PRO66525.1 MFS transporter [Alkalicoccus urumqiensis]
MKLWKFSIRRPKFTIVIMTLLLLLGSVSLTRLPVQLLPDIEAPAAAVVTSYPGAGPSEVLSDVTEPLENDLSDISGLSQLTSQTEEGSSIIIMEFGYSTSIDDVENDIISTINQTELPDEAGQPAFLQFDPSMFPSMQLAVASSDEEVTAFQDDVADLQQELSRVPGVASVDESGRIDEVYDVVLDTDVLQNNNLTQEDIVNVIQGSQMSLPGGTIVNEDEGETITTRLLSEISSLEELEDLVVTEDPETGETLTISDAGEVAQTTEDQDVITRLNQDNSIQLDVMFESEADTSETASLLRDEIDDQLEEDDFSDLNAAVLYDEGEFIDEAISSVMLSLIGGGILAMVLLFAFLRNLKTPLIIGIAIPFSVIATFALFFFTDITLNIMTIGGLALGIGMLVDNSIVVIENIYRHLSMGKTPREAAADGTGEVAGAITASTLTTASVFLPIVFVTGFVGDLFAPLAITVSFSLFASLFVAVTVVPMIASRILRTPESNLEAARKEKWYMKRLAGATKWTLRYRLVVILITLITLGVGAAGLAVTGVNLLPDSDEGTFLVEIEHEEGTLLTRTEETVAAVEDEIDGYDEVESYLSTIGSSSAQGGVTSSTNTAEVIVTMVDAADRDVTSFNFIEEIESDIESVDEEAEITVQAFAQAGFGGDPNTFSFSLQDEDNDRLEEAVADVVTELEDVDDFRNVETTLDATSPELQLTVDREAAREQGLAPAQIGASVLDATNGVTAGTLELEGEDALPVNVRYPDDVLSSQQAFQNILIPDQQGGFVELSEVTEAEEGSAPPTINRADQEPTVDVDVRYAADLTLQEAGVMVQDAVDDAGLSSNTEYIVGGDQELLDDVLGEIALAFVLGLTFIYLVMVAQFESFKYPFIVMFTVPLFIIGVMLSLTVTQNPLSVMVFIGIIVLAGIVVNNAIVLVDYINQLKERGYTTPEAIETGVQDRVRPILITALTTILGVVPLAAGFGEGTELIQPMGIVIIGGLISSTFLTLFVIPVVYSFFDKTTRNMNKKYMTPDGRFIYQRDIIAQQSSYEGGESSAASYDTRSEQRGTEEYYTPLLPEEKADVPEEKRRPDQELPRPEADPRVNADDNVPANRSGEEDIVDEMEQLLQRMKEKRRQNDDTNNDRNE